MCFGSKQIWLLGLAPLLMGWKTLATYLVPTCNLQVHCLESRNSNYTHFLGYWIGLSQLIFVKGRVSVSQGCELLALFSWRPGKEFWSLP